MSEPVQGISRRQLLGAGAALPLALSPSLTTLAQQPVATSDKPTAKSAGKSTAGPPMQAQADYTLNIQSKSISPLGKAVDATLVDGTLPGPTIKYREGEMFRVQVNNQLQVPTTVHWHGMLVPSYMDGVPGVAQYPIAPGEAVLYEYPLRQNGTYWYHSHYQLQEQSGLSGPLIVEARDEPHAYDHDVVVFLSDWLNQSPESVVPELRGERPTSDVTRPVKPGGYPFPGEKPFAVDLDYPGYLLKGRSSESPWTLKVRRGDRIRFRFINGSTATFFQVALAGHSLKLIAADGQNIDPIDVSNVVIATAERYDALVTIRESGSFTLSAAALGTHRKVVGVVHTADAAAKADMARATFTGPSGGLADYAALRSPYPTTLPTGPVQTFDIDLGGVMKKYLWSMAREYYPELYVPEGTAGPLSIHQGDRVRIRFTNSTMMYHPMHLHGHFFRLLRKPGGWADPNAPLKDTVGVGPKETIDIEFTADNPGKWFFHCHNLYHLACGMAREVRYVVPSDG